MKTVSPVAVVLCLTILAAPGSRADEQSSTALGPQRANTWAARSSTGLVLGGTWTATEDAKTGAVTGTWTLVDAKGQLVAQGGWSAAKSPAGWTGNWRAAAVGRPGEYSGTWAATVDLKPNARFADLFVRAAEKAVSGTWRSSGLSGSWTIQAFQPPAELVALASKAKLEEPFARWCTAEFAAGQRAFAVAVARGTGGRYLALDADGRATELASFTGRADLSCYTRAEAEKLDRSLRQSKTLQGQITPRWTTTVVCGFVEDTAAECWQYSPTDRMFVKVGQWTT